MQIQQFISPKDLLITELAKNAPDVQLRIELPAKYVKRFQKKLKQSGTKWGTQDVLHNLISIMLTHTIQRKSLSPIFGPSPIVGSEEPKLKKDSPIVLEVAIDHWDELGEINYSDIIIQKPVQEITEEMINEEMLVQQWMAGEHTATNNPIDSDVECRCSLETLDTETGNTLSAPVHVSIATNLKDVRVHGCSFPNGNAFLGKSVGDEVSFTAVPSINWPQAQLRSKKVLFKFTLDSIATVAPATVEIVLEQYGTQSEFILRNQILASMEQQFADGVAICMQEQLLDAISDKVKLHIPQRVIKSAVHFAKQEIERGLNAKSVDTQANKKILEELTPQCEKKAELSSRRKAITMLLIKSHKTQPTEEELIDFIASEAAIVGKRPDEYRQELIDSGQMDEVSRRLFLSLIVLRLLNQCNQIPISHEEWNSAIAFGSTGL